ncbi:glycosyltransferase family protein [Mucilaginibacter aquatilis]|uniref:Glycosyltransferase family 1 protein n=1 Tax=Mucilaginibacter aquatilis TaxID=1517760 RepID=A0A6I4ICV6_9SPHI|nr:hypothetical protein [Mucilaginibacter aquatilis]MVN92787.1 hypothetical protein [Mucilaginibacter aquatilis]
MSNVAFYFSSVVGINTGKGGAYYSLLTYRNELQREYGTQVIHYNELSHPTVIDAETDVLLKPAQSFTEKYNELWKYFKEYRPEAIFSFSQKSLTLLLRWFCLIYGCKFIYVRAGGGNYKLTQFFNNIIFYSNENMEFCKGKQVKNSYLVSNRVEVPQPNNQRVSQFTTANPAEADSLKILRVSRINFKYLQTFISAINQHKRFKEMGINVVTHLIGYEEDAKAAEEIKKQIEGVEGIKLFTDAEHTSNTQELIPYYDIVIGIGRGFWEAVAYGKLVLGFASNSEVPVLVTPQNIDTFIKYNFSDRVKLDSFETFVDAYPKFNSNEFTDSYINDLRTVFDEHYSSAFLVQKLKKVIADSHKEDFMSLANSCMVIDNRVEFKQGIKKIIKGTKPSVK